MDEAQLNMPMEPPPFSIRVLRNDDDIDTSSLGHAPVSPDFLPASFRVEENHNPHLYVPDFGDIAFLEQEFDLGRLDAVWDWLWLAGIPKLPRPLHHQQVLGRKVVVAERLDLHLVWTTGQIFLKPVPPYLLEPSFWSDHLSCRQPMPGDAHWPEGVGGTVCCPAGSTRCRRPLRRRALGFLLSYAALITHQSDFLLAREAHLLPEGVVWPAWRGLVQQILGIEVIDRRIDRRFHYGELRLGRLNKIYLLRGVMDGYMAPWDRYAAFLQANFAWVASATVYIAIVLSAMQLGLATTLADNLAFQSASRGFTIFAILGPLVLSALILSVFLYIFIVKLIATVRFKIVRFRAVEALL